MTTTILGKVLTVLAGSFLFPQAALAQWVVETSKDGNKTAYSEDTPSKDDENISAYLAVYPHDEGGCSTEIHVFRGDDYDDIVEFQKKDWFKYRFDTEVDSKEVLISGEPYDDGGAFIFNGSNARRATERDWPRIQRRERIKTMKLLSEHNEFVIRLPLKDGSPVFAISLEGADDAIKEACL